jgi:hypothetical protein
MSSSINIPALAPPRSLRSNTLVTSSSPSGPSNINLFLRNLRLLELDRRDDWPGIAAVTFSTKDTQQNQKRRVQCVEWALYQLFTLWDPEGSRNVLRLPTTHHVQQLTYIPPETTAILPSARAPTIPQPSNRPLSMPRPCQKGRGPRPGYRSTEDYAG